MDNKEVLGSLTLDQVKYNFKYTKQTTHSFVVHKNS